MCTRLLRCGDLPDSGGVPSTVIITISEHAWRTGTGSATTGHGAVLTAQQAIHLAGADHRIIAVALDNRGAITAHGTTHRSFKPHQRLAMAARDGGWSFPGCTVPPAWCRSHRVREYRDGGHTIVANGTLLCGFHHHDFQRLGWTCRFIDGAPAWIPPPWLDPDQTPPRNTAHHVQIEFAAPRVPEDDPLAA